MTFKKAHRSLKWMARFLATSMGWWMKFSWFPFQRLGNPSSHWVLWRGFSYSFQRDVCQDQVHYASINMKISPWPLGPMCSPHKPLGPLWYKLPLSILSGFEFFPLLLCLASVSWCRWNKGERPSQRRQACCEKLYIFIKACMSPLLEFFAN